jgi:predicted acylesterase/phospholipase RssA
MTNFVQLEKKPGTALVLSGGATKAFYFHLGVLKVLAPETISSIIGTSAGAIIGALIASGATTDNLLTSLHQQRVYMPRFEKWVKTLTSTMLFRPKYQDITRLGIYTGYDGIRFLLSLPWLYNKDILAEAIDQVIESQARIPGFFDSIALENLFRSLLPSADFADAVIDLYVIATCLDCRERAVFNGHCDCTCDDSHFMNDVPIHRAVRASSSLPGMFEPVKIKGKYYIDGEIRRTLSADIAVNLADRIIISHTYQPLYMPPEQGSVRDLGWINILKQTAWIMLEERIAVWRQIYERENPDKEIIWIQPDPEDVDFFLAPEFSFRTEQQQQMIHSGEIAARHALGQLEGKPA